MNTRYRPRVRAFFRNMDVFIRCGLQAANNGNNAFRVPVRNDGRCERHRNISSRTYNYYLVCRRLCSHAFNAGIVLSSKPNSNDERRFDVPKRIMPVERNRNPAVRVNYLIVGIPSSSCYTRALNSNKTTQTKLSLFYKRLRDEYRVLVLLICCNRVAVVVVRSDNIINIPIATTVC